MPDLPPSHRPSAPAPEQTPPEPLESRPGVQPDAPLYRLRLNTHVGPLHLDLELTLNSRWTVIFGPTGSGKSTILRAICGLLDQPSHADISNIFARTTSAAAPAPADRRLHRTPPHLRQLAYAPQGAVLFPHMSARQNIAFPTQARLGASPSRQSPDEPGADAAIIDQAIESFQLQALAERRPADLSGGERQRVNLARAFAVPHPRLILLDEPFTGIDRALRDALLPRMQQLAHQLGAPVLSVTHDVEEALLLHAQVIRLGQGRIIDQGPASRVLAEERSRMLQILL
ncbi:MAG: ATP-binding cassette domain-containing protein [Acidobacteriaceae bacterium]